MRGAPTCPRCGAQVHAPDVWSSDWTCDRHGAVHPVAPVAQPTSDLLHQVASSSAVPVWLPWPLPQGWLVTGVVQAGDERSGARAVGVSVSGPAPFGGFGELLLVAEEPGVGLGARFAGLESADPGLAAAQGSPSAKVRVDDHPTSLWSVPTDSDRMAYVGEAFGRWLWAVLFPADAAYLLDDDVRFMDLRDHGEGFDVPCGALSPRLSS